ncbi:hypothetical protein H1P_10072 [Hyella patelloides LEGE 07179]|uniref:Uncharacterized protein n=1 Tax=Hyella patelloides LEGE 07179 TaxID=945734 RepID=A0A563VIY6_9CYAN|nr:hypothetical protein H1P_10072 [Hyella patelloides LEGE 07179]
MLNKIYKNYFKIEHFFTYISEFIFVYLTLFLRLFPLKEVATFIFDPQIELMSQI